jgi:hypothetical protein
VLLSVLVVLLAVSNPGEDDFVRWFEAFLGALGRFLDVGGGG